MKQLKVLALALLVAPFAKAQTLQEAIQKTENERYEAADADFKQLIAKEPTNSNLYFYYGENFFEHEDLEKAHEQWQKGLSVDPECMLNTVGAGKYLWYKGDTTAGRQYFNKALTATKNKNAEVMRQIAEVLTNAPKRDLKGAIALMEKAIKLDGKNVESHLIMGDALQYLTPADGSPAIKSYNAALAIDPKSAKALVKTAQLYQRAKNYELANQKYIDAQKADPTYAPAYRLNGELNLLFNQGKRAAENYTKYLELNNSTEARYRYASALFISKKYCEVLPEVSRVESEGFSNAFTKRMLSYSLYECNNAGAKTPEEFKKALAENDNFFKVAKTEQIIPSDYATRGRILSAMGNDSLAAIELERAIEADPAGAAELYTELAKIYYKAKKYDQTIAVYERKMAGDPSKLNAAENYDLGRSHYFGSKNYVEADSAFARLTRQSPTWAIGYHWKARSAYKLDDPKATMWLAQPGYEQYLNLLTPEEKANPSYKSATIEAAKYLGDYYVNSPAKDYVKAKEYWNIVLSLDPADKQAKAFFASPAGK